ncbi:MAG: hypothetical protein ABEJ61_08720 [Haloferacaceae archaeon]
MLPAPRTVLLQLLRLAAALVAGYFAVGAARWTVRHLGTALTVARTPALDGTAPSGAVRALAGTVRPADRTLEAPLTGTACVAYAFHVGQDRVADDPLTTLDQATRGTAAGSDAVPFRLRRAGAADARVRPVERDDAGRPTEEWERLDLPGVELPGEWEESAYPLLGVETSERVREHVEAGGGDERQETYASEERLDPGTAAFVVGPVRRDGGDLVVEHRPDEPFVVARGDRAAAVRRYLLAAAGNAAFGLAAAAVLAVLATPAGTLLAPLA